MKYITDPTDPFSVIAFDEPEEPVLCAASHTTAQDYSEAIMPSGEFSFKYTKGVSIEHIDTHCEIYVNHGYLAANAGPIEKRFFLEDVASRVRSVSESLRALALT